MTQFFQYMEKFAAMFGTSVDIMIWSSAGVFLVISTILTIRVIAGSTVSKSEKAQQAAMVKIKKYLDSGNVKEAAVLLAEQGMHEQAAKAYAKAGALPEALASAEKTKNHQLILGLLEKMGQFTRMAELYESRRQYKEAAQALERGQVFDAAADMWVTAGALKQGASAAVKGGHFEKAGRIAAKSKDYELAAKIFLQGYKKKSAEKGKPDGRFAVLTSDALNKVGKREQALKILIQAGRDAEAKEMGEKYDVNSLGARLAKEAGNSQLAGWFVQAGGDPAQAARVQAEGLVKSDPFGAAQLFVEAGDHDKAARLFEKSGYPGEAAAQYEAAEMWADAVRLYKKDKDSASLARVYFNAGQYADAAVYYASLGDLDKAYSCYEKSGDWEKAVQFARKNKWHDRAIGLLNKVPSTDPKLWLANCIKGELILQTGSKEAAINAFKDGLSSQKVNEQTLPYFYAFARLLQKTGRGKSSITLFQRILDYDPTYKDVAKLLGAQNSVTATRAGESAATAPKAQAQAAPSAQPDRYVMLGTVGRGGMGIVYKAHDTQLDRIVAYKVLPDEFQQHKGAAANFMREARTAASMTHPNIVIVHDVGNSGGKIFLVMEFLEGKNLKEILNAKGAFSLADVLNIGKEVAQGLGYAHDKKLVHRDIKPSNIMRSTGGKIKIMDFGLAKVVREVTNQQTVAGGTPYYMSPEQVRGLAVGPETDLYALGCTLFELAAGRVPFKEGDISYHHVYTEAPRVRSLNPDVPQALDDIIFKLMQKEPSDRYRTAAQLIADLDAVQG